jgi:hypothetical protein
MEQVSPISFLTALVATNEIIKGHILQIYTLLKQLLKQYDTAGKWNESKPRIYSMTIQFPFLDISSRTHAQRELKKWSESFQVLTATSPHRFRNEFF